MFFVTYIWEILKQLIFHTLPVKAHGCVQSYCHWHHAVYWLPSLPVAAVTLFTHDSEEDPRHRPHLPLSLSLSLSHSPYCHPPTLWAEGLLENQAIHPPTHTHAEFASVGHLTLIVLWYSCMQKCGQTSLTHLVLIDYLGLEGQVIYVNVFIQLSANDSFHSLWILRLQILW